MVLASDMRSGPEHQATSLREEARLEAEMVRHGFLDSCVSCQNSFPKQRWIAPVARRSRHAPTIEKIKTGGYAPLPSSDAVDVEMA